MGVKQVVKKALTVFKEPVFKGSENIDGTCLFLENTIFA